MKIYILTKIAAFSLLTATLTSCNLDVVPPSEISAESFWKTEKDAWYGLNSCYAAMPGFSITSEMYVDNVHSHKPWEGPFELMQQDGISVEDDLGYDFTTIRLANNFLENVDRCNMDSKLKDRMKAEARFFRAYQYLTLTNLFGKVPIITTTLEYNAPSIARDPKEKVEKFILDELSEIAEILPNKYDGGYLKETGRITRAAALTVKASAALSFGKFDVAESASGLVISEGFHSLHRVTTLNDAQKKEAEEMDQFIDFDALGVDKDRFIKGMFSYESVWHNVNASPSNPEYILTREYMASDQNSDWARYIYLRPSQLVTGYASYEPMQDLISAYWNIDGKSLRVEPSFEERKSAFLELTDKFVGLDQKGYIAKVSTMDLKNERFIEEFRNRDSRLYGSILFPCKGWHETDKGEFYYRSNPADYGKNGNETWSGYAFRKMVTLEPYKTQDCPDDYPVIRYAETLLIFAEARIQNKGWDGEVQVVLNDLRDRCGMPNVPSVMGSKQEALDFVRNERRIELAGEGQRFNDIRRYGSDYCKKVMSGTTYAPSGYLLVTKKWSDRLLLMPLPQTALDRNPLLVDDQNPGYN